MATVDNPVMATRKPERVELRDGSRVAIRPVSPGDKSAFAEGFEHLSASSRYMRFLTPVQRLRPADLAYFTEVDHHDHEALVAYSLEGEPLAAARYVRVDERTAEAAVAVVDHWQGRGLGTALLQRLAARAGHEGIDWFTATLLAENRQVLSLLDDVGERTVRQVGGGVLEARVKLPAVADPNTPLRRALRSAASGEVEGRPERVTDEPQARPPK
jgi:GNAT superfamily N-acetyltransferase